MNELFEYIFTREDIGQVREPDVTVRESEQLIQIEVTRNGVLECIDQN